MSEEPRNHEVNAKVLASVVGSLLEPKEGVIVHLEGRGYFVFLAFNDDDQEYDVMINEDPDFLRVPNFAKVAMVEEEETEFETPTLQ